VQAVRESVRHASRKGSAASLHSTLAAADEAVRLALTCEAAAEGAALSLGQRETMDSLRAELCEASAALGAALQAQGRGSTPNVASSARGFRLRLPDRFRLSDRSSGQGPQGSPTWWFALTEAIEALGEGAERLEALASGQPKAAPARAVAEATAELLRGHHACLLKQADRWLS